MKIQEIDIERISENPKNPRTISHQKFELLKKSISEFPDMLQKRPLICITANGGYQVLGGNMRLKALQELGIKSVPVMLADDWSEKQRKRFLIADNLQMGDWSWEMLESDWSKIDLESWGMDIPDFVFQGDVTEDDFTVPDEIVTDIKRGDLFQIGSHRLYCGDATCREDVERLMGGEKANMCFTDPPYLMKFTGNVHKDGSKSFNAKYKDIENDKLDEAESGMFLSKIAVIIKQFVKGSYYLCFYRLGIEKIINALQLNGLNYKSLIIWHKNNHNLSNSDYQSIYEPIVYGWNEQHNFYGTRSNFDLFIASRNKKGEAQIATQTKAVYIKSQENFYKFERLKRTPKNYLEVRDGQNLIFNIFSGSNDIWEIDKTKKNDLHPTMKPLELCAKAITNSSKEREIVMDLFGGSDSTLIACEKLKRKCAMMEISEQYCQVILDRAKKAFPDIEIKQL